MCQAYAGEAAYIRSMENRASTEGYLAHHQAKELTANPYHHQYDGYAHKAWSHGWRCRDQGMVPWAIESAIQEKRREAFGNEYAKVSTKLGDAFVSKKPPRQAANLRINFMKEQQEREKANADPYFNDYES